MCQVARNVPQNLRTRY